MTHLLQAWSSSPEPQCAKADGLGDGDKFVYRYAMLKAKFP